MAYWTCLARYYPKHVCTQMPNLHTAARQACTSFYLTLVYELCRIWQCHTNIALCTQALLHRHLEGFSLPNLSRFLAGSYQKLKFVIMHSGSGGDKYGKATRTGGSQETTRCSITYHANKGFTQQLPSIAVQEDVLQHAKCRRHSAPKTARKNMNKASCHKTWLSMSLLIIIAYFLVAYVTLQDETKQMMLCWRVVVYQHLMDSHVLLHCFTLYYCTEQSTSCWWRPWHFYRGADLKRSVIGRSPSRGQMKEGD